jgi:hypothetical protein
MRDQLKTARADASVRSVARALGWSSGRVGDLLKIRDAFPDEMVELIGTVRFSEARGARSDFERGNLRLSSLSFRTLRTVASRAPRPRFVSVRDFVKVAANYRADLEG